LNILVYHISVADVTLIFIFGGVYLTIEELSKCCNVALEKLKIFEKSGIITPANHKYSDKDLNMLSTLLILYDSGVKIEDIKRFCVCDSCEQTKILTSYRFVLLDEIHKKQKNLDKLDYIIYEIKNNLLGRNEL
jgi:DNA-binding transcriptional MerR regulator